MQIKSIDQLVMLTGDGRFIFVSDFMQMSAEEMKQIHIPYTKLEFNRNDVFCINPPKTYAELGQFIEAFHPNFAFVIWWSKRYGNNNWRKLHGISMIRRKRERSYNCGGLIF